MAEKEYIERCVDCLHFKACQDWATDMFGADTQFPYEARSNLCEHFKSAADVVEVVRCQDCKRWLKDVAGCTDFVGRCEWANYMVGANGYCVYGEAKMDGKGEN